MKYEYNTLYGTSAKKEKICAYCKWHRKNMTVRQVHKKDCLRKQCKYLKKLEHQWWIDREKKKELRQKRKEYINTFFE